MFQQVLDYKAWFCLSILRLYLSILPQYGYIHPDEFFQTVEMAAGHIFGLNITTPWEFSESSPVRSWSQVVISSYPPLYLLKFLSHFYNTITPYKIFISERLYCCLISFIVDFSMFKFLSPKSSKKIKQNKSNKMAILASSSSMLLFQNRSLTNSLELIIFSLLFLPLFKQSSLRSIIFYSFIPVLGTFIRPTFVFFAIVPYLCRLAIVMGIRQKIYFVGKHVLISFLFFIFFVLFDSYSYNLFIPSQFPSYILQHGFKSFFSTNLTITPLNFILYNSNINNLATHGIHPRLTHFTINAYLLFSSLIIIAYKTFITNIFKSNFQSFLFTPSFWLVPFCLFSFFPHQEARFLIPLIIPLTLSYSRHLCKNKPLLLLWLFSNTMVIFFYGFVHQAGLMRAVLDARTNTIPHFNHHDPLPSSSLSTDITLIFWKTYMPPKHLLLLPNHPNSCPHPLNHYVFCGRDVKVDVSDLGGGGEEEFVKRISTIRSWQDMFVYVPGSVIVGGDCLVSSTHKLTLLHTYWPHFTGENLFFLHSNMADFKCHKRSQQQYPAIEWFFWSLFGFHVPHVIIDLIDRTSFKVYKVTLQDQ